MWFGGSSYITLSCQESEDLVPYSPRQPEAISALYLRLCVCVCVCVCVCGCVCVCVCVGSSRLRHIKLSACKDELTGINTHTHTHPPTHTHTGIHIMITRPLFRSDPNLETTDSRPAVTLHDRHRTSHWDRKRERDVRNNGGEAKMSKWGNRDAKEKRWEGRQRGKGHGVREKDEAEGEAEGEERRKRADRWLDEEIKRKRHGNKQGEMKG